jgi:hypothetical protein
MLHLHSSSTIEANAARGRSSAAITVIVGILDVHLWNGAGLGVFEQIIAKITKQKPQRLPMQGHNRGPRVGKERSAPVAWRHIHTVCELVTTASTTSNLGLPRVGDKLRTVNFNTG